MVFKKKNKEDLRKIPTAEDYEDDSDLEDDEEEELTQDKLETTGAAGEERGKSPKGKSDTWVVQEVPTETQRVIVNTETKEAYDLYSAVAKILEILSKV